MDIREWEEYQTIKKKRFSNLTFEARSKGGKNSSKNRLRIQGRFLPRGTQT